MQHPSIHSDDTARLEAKMDIEIRKEESRDIDSIFELNSLAFESNSEARLVNNLRDKGLLILSLVAIVDGKLMGHIAFSPMRIPSFDQLKLVGLAPMAVHPSLQRKGIGTKLVKEGLRELERSNVDAVFLLGHKEYYPRFGFVPSFSSFGIKSKYDVPDDVFMAMELKSNTLSRVNGLIEYSKEFDKP